MLSGLQGRRSCGHPLPPLPALCRPDREPSGPWAHPLSRYSLPLVSVVTHSSSRKCLLGVLVSSVEDTNVCPGADVTLDQVETHE